MRKFGIFILMILFGQIGAQTFKYGVTGNLHRGSIVNVHDRSEGKWGGSVGFFTQWSLVENDIYDSAWLYFMPQIEYSMQGENADASPNKYDKQKYNYDYVNVNAYLRYFFHKGNMKRDVFIFAGPKVEFLVRDDKKVDPKYDEVYYKFNKDDKVNGIGLGVSAGTGIKINTQFEAFLRYDRSFSKVYTNNTERNTYNRMVVLGINYYLGDSNW